MLRCTVGVQEQDGDRLEILFFQDLRYAAYRLFVQWCADRAVGQDALWDLEDVLARNQGPMLFEARVEGFGAIDAADFVDVAEALGGEQRGARAGAFDNRVDNHGR